MVDLHRLRLELAAACEDAAIDAATLVVWVIAGARPPGTTPLAYLQPAGEVRADTVRVFRAVGSERAGAQRESAHRLALWGVLPGLPDAALGPMLRHELEHARRWERSGPRFFEADDLLRDAVRGAGAVGYATLPSELEANAASATYAARTLAPTELEALRELVELRPLLEPGAPPADVVDSTVAAVERRRTWTRAYGDEVRAACREWSPAPFPRVGMRVEVV
jgi:hypothetical protein